MERNTHCVRCGEPNVDDCLSEDGLCFPCDVEETCERIGAEDVPTYLDALSQALQGTPVSCGIQVPSTGSLGVN